MIKRYVMSVMSKTYFLFPQTMSGNFTDYFIISYPLIEDEKKRKKVPNADELLITSYQYSLENKTAN